MFGLFVVYGFSGYAIYIWRKAKGMQTSVIRFTWHMFNALIEYTDAARTQSLPDAANLIGLAAQGLACNNQYAFFASRSCRAA